MEADGKSRNDLEFPRQPLVSVERQIETNLETGRSQTRMFVKMYFETRDSGLLATLPAELWQTLCCLATYMDVDGYCYPGQRRMARDLGISRQQLNSRLQKLVAFRFQDRPVMHVTKERRGGGGQWDRNVYKVLPISGLGIFGDKPTKGREDAAEPVKPLKAVSTRLDTGSVSSRTDADAVDMNQSPKENKITPTVWPDGDTTEDASKLVARFHHRIGRDRQRATLRELRHAAELVASYGTERAQFIIEYAVREAKTTNFRMRHFGAVCSYVEDALGAFASRQSKLQRDEAQRQRRCDEDLRVRYESWRRLEVERLKARMEPDARERLGDEVRADVMASYGGVEPPAFATLVRIRFAERVSAIHQIPSFELWRRRARKSELDSPSFGDCGVEAKAAP